MGIFNTRIPKKVLSNPLKHVALICDGNGRWAKNRGLPRTAGHEVGIMVVKDIAQACAEAGIRVVTMFAFSTENWNRPKDEVESLMNLFIRFFKEWRIDAVKKGMRVNHIGFLEGLPEELKKEIETTHTETFKNTNMIFNVALNYGGRSEIIAATQNIAKKLQKGVVEVNDVDERMIDASLFTANQPNVDILIRTGSESRLSNFLLWQSSNAVIVSLPILWPDFRRKHLWKSFDKYYNSKII